MRILLTILAVLCLFGFDESSATDANGHFAIKGAGNSSCQQFLDARNEAGKAYFLYGGWLDGFMTAANLYEKNTFDLASWQSSDVLLSALANYCRQQPETTFQVAVSKMTRTLFPDRLGTRSPQVKAQQRGRAVIVYEEVLRQAQTRLGELGYLSEPPSGAFDPATSEAIEAFQEKLGLEKTGLPDQVTLFYLIDKGE